MLFQQALEVACKGLRQEIHILLAADHIDYKVAKFVVKDKLSTHRLGKILTTTFTLEDFDLQRSCTFAEAWDRVKQLVPLLPEYSKAGLSELNKLRNGITHFGAERERDVVEQRAIGAGGLQAGGIDEDHEEVSLSGKSKIARPDDLAIFVVGRAGFEPT